MNFYQDQNKRKHKLIYVAISKNDESDRVVDLLFYENHYALIKKLHFFLGNYHKTIICKRCLNSYTSETMLRIQNSKCEDQELTTIRTSSESHLQWKKHFHRNPLYFKTYAYFEADNEIDNSGIGNKTIKI